VQSYSPFVKRHIGISEADEVSMLSKIGVASRNELIQKTVPGSILKTDEMDLASGISEAAALAEINALAEQNQLASNHLGQGYYGCLTPPVIQRLILENPGWYTAYTPYQAEISQGRLEMLLNFQQMICDLTAMPVTNASLLDEGTAAAEAMSMAKRSLRKNKSNCFFVDQNCHPQTIAVVKTRAKHFGYEVVVGDLQQDLPDCFATLIQYPATCGEIIDPRPIIAKTHEAGALAIVATDLLALTLMTPPGEMGADIVIGTSQRFGVPMGFGGPHAAFFAFQDSFKRSAPGRIVGVSADSRGRPAFRMAMQTREQHIRREKATSNICTSQVLLAVIAAAYAVYHGPEGLKEIALSVHQLCSRLAASLKTSDFKLQHTNAFDTLEVNTGDRTSEIAAAAQAKGINLRVLDNSISVSFDETHGESHLQDLCELFGTATVEDAESLLENSLIRNSAYLEHEVFHRFRSETEFMRYLQRLQSKDLALDQAMIPLGSCTMKLNAAAEMQPISWPKFSQLHPYSPSSQTKGYQKLISQMEQMLCACTGYDAVSVQPNAGSQGEYAGLLAIAAYHKSRGDAQRKICLIPESAHGTNPASAQMAGMQVVVVACDEKGNVDLSDLKAKAEEHSNDLAAAMLTYPSTHGVFETAIQKICEVLHTNGAQVYIDGANLNAMVGLAEPGKFGGDVSHLNLHKTFCIPHGGGGPGVGPIGVKQHLAEFLPADPNDSISESDCVSSARWGSASILPISWMYIRMMGGAGLKAASEFAILNANYIASRLQDAYPVLYRGANGFVAHECILDIRPLKAQTGISEEDIAKRLVDYGFHAPTMSFPVPGTLMIEPTESESLSELDRFCEAMLSIRAEIEKVVQDEWSLEDNPLVNAPHTLDDVTESDWQRAYSRDLAVKPSPYQSHHKYWPAVNRIDNVLGDRNLICSCPPLSDYSQ
jgi:glycine dehydrogenase|tara:strand:+ start:121873 stop:124686 length:2814 start_codon:yes stop_codon:yes gene_type:complete